MILTEPAMEYAPQIRAYRQEFIDSGDSMDGTGGLGRFEAPAEWIEYTRAMKSPDTVPDGLVPATQCIYVRESDGKIVGMLQIRHYLNEYLEKFGGHVGYSVAPSERRKGYASAMLRAALEKCRALGIESVLITCYRENEASRRTILKNGGVYDSTVFEEKDGKYCERYWIDLSKAGSR